MQQVRGVKRPHEVTAPGWPTDAKRQAVAPDYPAGHAHVLLLCVEYFCFLNNSVEIWLIMVVCGSHDPQEL